jgi:hypothetical protein
LVIFSARSAATCAMGDLDSCNPFKVVYFRLSLP